MRIMIAGSAYAPARNGQAVFTTNLAEGLAKHGHKVAMVVDSQNEQESHTMVNGVEVFELASIGLDVFHSDLKFTPFPGREIRRIFNTFQPDLVHIQDHFPISRAAVVEAHRRGIRVVGSNHFIPENVAPYLPGVSRFTPVFYWVSWEWMKDVYRRVDVISAQSKAAVRLMKEQGLNNPMLPISCGLDLNVFKRDPSIDRQLYQQRYGINPGKTTFLYVGRNDGEKRIDLLIDAMKMLNRDDIQMVIAGRGRAEVQLHQQAADLLKNGKVVFTGFIPPEDLPGLLNSVDVFVMPSEAELLSISTLEAMACGLPVLLADALALPELVRVGENGYLFKAGDPDDLVEKIQLITNGSAGWTAMGAVSREIARAHSLEETLSRFEMIYKQLLRQRPTVEVKQGFRRAV